MRAESEPLGWQNGAHQGLDKSRLVESGGLRFCMSDELSGDANAAGLGITL